MDRYDLDHVALAAADTSEAMRFLTGPLGGTVLFGGLSDGFRPMQVWVGTPDGDGMSIELLEPWAPERNDFLARFVARHRAGPHHLTVKVPDLPAALARVRAAGLHPVNIDVADPDWREAFLMPNEANGTVIQLADTTHDQGTRAEHLAHVARAGPDAHPRWWVDPAPAEGPPARLRRVVMRTADLPAALALFSDLLQGEIAGKGAGWAELLWPRGSRVRLEERTDAPPGIDRLEIEGLSEARTLIGTRLVPAPE